MRSVRCRTPAYFTLNMLIFIITRVSEIEWNTWVLNEHFSWVTFADAPKMPLETFSVILTFSEFKSHINKRDFKLKKINMNFDARKNQACILKTVNIIHKLICILPCNV